MKSSTDRSALASRTEKYPEEVKPFATIRANQNWLVTAERDGYFASLRDSNNHAMS